MTSTSTSNGWSARPKGQDAGNSAADALLHVVDAGLVGALCVAPFFFGGRHDLGRLVLVSIVGVTAVAWFARQSLIANAHWPRTAAHALLLAAISLLALQILPLPEPWLAWLCPRNFDLLSLWSSRATGPVHLGTWQTASLDPHETQKSLAMLVCYALLFVVVSGRIQQRTDLVFLVRTVAIAATLMAVFGIVHYATSDGDYFWFWKHPYRSATRDLSGAFVNRNHFAHFLVLGLGPLCAWMLSVVKTTNTVVNNHRAPQLTGNSIVVGLLGAATATVVLAVFLSLSRGGIVALFVAAAVIAAIYSRAGLIGSKYGWGALALAGLMVGLLSMYGYEQVAQRLTTMTGGSIDAMDMNGGRRNIWEANRLAIQAGGLLGAGAGSHKMIYPLYLEKNPPFEYSHAENGYLQIATENGFVGATLLFAGLAICVGWMIGCFRHTSSKEDQLLFGAIAGGLAVSMVHSIVDFVWYIPACMSMTVVLAAMMLRLSQMARPTSATASLVRLRRARWLELTAASALAGAWSVHTFVGPAMAAVHWDRYMRLSASNSELKNQQWSDIVANNAGVDPQSRTPLNDMMISELEQVTSWDPQSARPRLRLAAKYLTRFELLQQHADNSMGRTQIKDAVQASQFQSQEQLDAWLEAAFGDNIKWLRQALEETRQAVALCPLQGEGYLYLADLSFLDSRGSLQAGPYVEQALRVRPYDPEVHYAIGERAWMSGDIETAIEHWRACYRDAGSHQLRIIHWLGGKMPAELFLSTFEPDWRTLPRLWYRYQQMGQTQDADIVVAFAAELAEREAREKPAAESATIWNQLADMYRHTGRHEEALVCLRRAHAAAPSNYDVRLALAHGLAAAGRYAESQPHYRWCLARRPTDQKLSQALKQVSKQHLAEREPRPRAFGRIGAALLSSPAPGTETATEVVSPALPTIRK